MVDKAQATRHLRLDHVRLGELRLCHHRRRGDPAHLFQRIYQIERLPGFMGIAGIDRQFDRGGHQPGLWARSPISGAPKKNSWHFSCVLGVISTALLYIIDQPDEWLLAALFYILGTSRIRRFNCILRRASAACSRAG